MKRPQPDFSDVMVFLILGLMLAILGLAVPELWASHTISTARIVGSEAYQGDNSPERIVTVEFDGQQYNLTITCTAYDNALVNGYTIQVERTTRDEWWIFFPTTRVTVASPKPGC